MLETYLQCFGAALFSLVFFYLWRQSGIIYFAYWSVAWIFEAVGAWPLPFPLHALLDFGFTISLVAATRVARPSAFRAFYALPALLLLLELVGRSEATTFLVLKTLLLGSLYLYCSWQAALGSRRLFRFALLTLSLFYFQSALAYLFTGMHDGAGPRWLAYINSLGYFDLALKTLLAFSAMSVWIENQNDRISQVEHDLDRMRRDSADAGDVDYLTGLLNQDSFRKRLDKEESFKGVVAVCDLDDFKFINDRFGHVVGDEVLRSVGHLLRRSIRSDDCAYRWGGDEMAILFQDQETSMAQNRMAGIEARLCDFRVRGYTSLQIELSWGVAEGHGVPLRQLLESADQAMYAKKRARGKSPVAAHWDGATKPGNP